MCCVVHQRVDCVLCDTSEGGLCVVWYIRGWTVCCVIHQRVDCVLCAIHQRVNCAGQLRSQALCCCVASQALYEHIYSMVPLTLDPTPSPSSILQ